MNRKIQNKDTDRPAKSAADVPATAFSFKAAYTNTTNDIEKQFMELAAKWKDETGAYSTTYQKINNSLLEIIGMGKEVVPFILKDLKNGTAHWHIALKVITIENSVPHNDTTKSKVVREAWLSWGRSKNLI